jgi:hypothetical protein
MQDPKTSEDHLPPLTWDQLEAVLISLADTADKQRLTRYLVEGTRKQAPFLPADETMREILCIGFALMDGDFRPPQLTAPLHA